MQVSTQHSAMAVIFALVCLDMHLGRPTIASVMPTSDKHSTGNNSLNGEFLIRLGQRYNKPLFKILGNSLQYLEKQIEDKMDVNKAEICELHTCSDWSEWSQCRGDHIGSFNMTSRVRQCGVNTTQCTYPLESYKNETEYQLCEVKCLDDYTVTTHGFCLKYHSTKKTNADSDATCLAESGGHLVNINSKEKSEDFVALQSTNGVTATTWIDGYRASVSSPWQFRHGDAPTSFSNWISGEPSNGAAELCKVHVRSSSVWYWYDRDCSNQYGFVCELI